MPYCINSQKGFALICVLVFIQLFVILTLYSLESSAWETKITRHYREKYLLQNAAEASLKQAETSLDQAKLTCQIPAISASKLLTQPIEWWQSKSCIGNFALFHYYYVIEFAGRDDCAYIEHKSPDSVANYYRVTLLLTDLKNSTRVMLQSSVIMPDAAAEVTCNSTRHPVAEGRQSWQEINN